MRYHGNKLTPEKSAPSIRFKCPFPVCGEMWHSLSMPTLKLSIMKQHESNLYTFIAIDAHSSTFDKSKQFTHISFIQCNLSKTVTVYGSHLSKTASLPGPK